MSFVECPGDGESGRGCAWDAAGLSCGSCGRNFCAYHIKTGYHVCYSNTGR